MLKEKKIMIIAHFCDYGEEQSNNRFNYLASMLHDTGCRVELITSSFSHRNKAQRKHVGERKNTYKTTLIYEPSYQKNISLKRLFYSHKKMAANLETYLHKCQKPDVVYCAIPSLSVAGVAAKYCNKNNIRFVVDIQDLWPEAFQMVLNIPLISNVIFAPFMKMANSIYEAADGIIGVSQTYVDRALSVNTKCKNGYPVFLGTDLNDFDENAKKNEVLKKSEGEIWLGYCGTLGRSYDLTTVISALSLMGKQAPKLIVMGDGPRAQEFKEYAQKKNVEAVFTGLLPYNKMCGLLCDCDIVVNPIAKGAAQSIINKHADYAMSGLPVISTQENEEYRNLVDTYQMGYNCENNNADELAACIMKLANDAELRKKCGDNARRCAEEKFNRKTTYQQILKIIEGII